MLNASSLKPIVQLQTELHLLVAYLPLISKQNQKVANVKCVLTITFY